MGLEECKHTSWLWDWELEIFLVWAEKAGLAKRMRYGGGKTGADEDKEADGWVVQEWWWLAFTTD